MLDYVCNFRPGSKLCKRLKQVPTQGTLYLCNANPANLFVY